MKNKPYLIILLITLAALFLTSCASSAGAAASTEPTASQVDTEEIQPTESEIVAIEHPVEAETINTAGAKEGDRVLIRIKAKSLLKTSFIFYMFPAIALLVGSFYGMDIGKKYYEDPELISILGGAIAFIISFIIVKFISMYIKGKKDYMSEVIKILPQLKSSDNCQ